MQLTCVINRTASRSILAGSSSLVDSANTMLTVVRSEESPDRHLQVRYDQKIAKYGNLANTSDFQLIPAVFSHTGQIHTVFKDFIGEQVRQKFVHFENQAKPSKINSVFKWWSKCISMVIAKTASRNVIYKANKLGLSLIHISEPTRPY